MFDQSAALLPVDHRNKSEFPVKRRISRRIRTVYHIAVSRGGTDVGLARVKRISDDRVMMQAQFGVQIGDVISLELSNGLSIPGRVVWTKGADCGVKLDEAVDSDALGANAAAQARWTSARPLQIPTTAIVASRLENATCFGELKDTTEQGISFRHGPFLEGREVTTSSGRESSAAGSSGRSL